MMNILHARHRILDGSMPTGHEGTQKRCYTTELRPEKGRAIHVLYFFLFTMLRNFIYGCL